jgi:hypothetical protein
MPNQSPEPTASGRGLILNVSLTMPAQFHASTSFAIPSRRMFIISGQIVSGVVKSGMTMNVRFNSGLALSLPIESVEFVDKKDGSEVGLTTICGDADELKFLEGLKIGDEDIEIADAPDEKNG